MAHRFSDLTFTPAVEAVQQQQGSYARMQQMRSRLPDYDRFGARERSFIAQRDSFYMATVSETGWPYLQHRGGEIGFLNVVADDCLAWVNQAGNGQYQSMGNLSHNPQVALFLVDYPSRRRLKILGLAQVYSCQNVPDGLASVLATELASGRAEQIIEIRLQAFDWNCSQYLTPRYSKAQLAELGIILEGDLA